MASEKIIQAKSGWAMLAANVIVYAASCAGLVYSIVLLASADDAGIEAPDFAVPLMIAGFVLLALGVCLLVLGLTGAPLASLSVVTV